MTSDNNVQPSELLKFDVIADEWWNPAGKLKTLHVINPVRLRYIESAVTLKNQRVLDIGCGGGLLTEAMSSTGAQVTGIDASETAIKIAANHSGTSGRKVDYLTCTIEQFEHTCKQPFDVITCMEMLEHVPDPSAVIASASRLLRPGGHLFLSTINRNLKAWLQTIVVAEHLLDLIPAGTHDYAQYIRPSELSRWLRSVGMEVADISGLGYLPLLDRAYADADPSVNYIMHALKPGFD